MELWSALDKTLDNSECGAGSDLVKGQGGTLDPATFHVQGAPALGNTQGEEPSCSSKPKPPPPELLPDMKGSIAIKTSIRALSPRIVAVHGPTGTGKSATFPLAVAHWTKATQGFTSGLTIRAQPTLILAQQLCERVRANRKTKESDKTVGCVIAGESLRDSSSKLLYCTSCSCIDDAVTVEQLEDRTA